MALAIFRDTVANPSRMAAKGIFLLVIGNRYRLALTNLKASEEKLVR